MFPLWNSGTQTTINKQNQFTQLRSTTTKSNNNRKDLEWPYFYELKVQEKQEEVQNQEAYITISLVYPTVVDAIRHLFLKVLDHDTIT